MCVLLKFCKNGSRYGDGGIKWWVLLDIVCSIDMVLRVVMVCLLFFFFLKCKMWVLKLFIFVIICIVIKYLFVYVLGWIGLFYVVLGGNKIDVEGICFC